jgi:uncharacterized protein YjbI with pentapeptide repeats
MNPNSNPSVLDPARRFRFLLPILAVALLAGLTLNIWVVAGLVRQQRTTSHEHDFWVLCQPGSAPVERETAFRHLVAAGNTQWRAAEVRGLNLAGITAPRADLQYAGFLRTNLAGAQLEGAKLCSANLELADLTGAQLTQADLREARLLQAVLKGATLRRANLAASTIEQIQAENADFVGADLSDVNGLMANFTGAKLMAANLAGARLESAVLNGANLEAARLEGADLTDASFTNANWWQARGLTTQQLKLFKQKFPPTAAASVELKEDFARWAAEPESR